MNKLILERNLFELKEVEATTMLLSVSEALNDEEKMAISLIWRELHRINENLEKELYEKES